MSERTKELFQIVDTLPDSEKNLIDELIRRVIIAWDPDFTKLSPEEAAILKQSVNELKDKEVFTENEIDWS